MPGFTSCELIKAMPPGKDATASFCMPLEGSIVGSACASPRKTCEIQCCLYSLSDIPRSFSTPVRSSVPGPRMKAFTGAPPGQERFSPANRLRRSATVRLDTGLFPLTTTARSAFCARADWMQSNPASKIRAGMFVERRFILSSASECHRQLYLQAVQVRLTLAESVVKLRFESHILVEVVAYAERGAMAQQHVFEHAVIVGIYVLVSKKWTNRAKLS